MSVHYVEMLNEGEQAFRLAMQAVFFDEDKQVKARSYCIDPEKGFCLYWAADCDGCPNMNLPYPMDCEACTEMVWRWLKEQKATDGPRDFDGDVADGFFVSSKEGFQNGWSYEIVAVRPSAILYGK